MNKLFAVYLGGKAKGARIEVHDLVFVIAKDVKSAVPQLKNLWFGDKSSAHVDNLIDVNEIIELTEVDGQSIRLKALKTPAKQPTFNHVYWPIR